MSVLQSNISTTIRSFNISDDIRIEVKKFRTNAGIDEVDIEDDEDDICVIQKIQKTFSDPENTTFDAGTLKSIIARLDAIEKKLEHIIYLNHQAENLSAAQLNGLLSRQLVSAGSGSTGPVGSTVDEKKFKDEMVDELKLELDSDPEQLMGDFIEQDELKLVEFPINRIEDLKELEDSIMSDQESFVAFVNFIGTAVQKHNRNLEPILRDFVTENLLNDLNTTEANDSLMSFYIFNQLLYDIWKSESSTMNEYKAQLKKIVTKIQNRLRTQKYKNTSHEGMET